MLNVDAPKWQDLNVTDSEGRELGTLGDIVADTDNPAADGITLTRLGQIESWDGYYIAAEGETPSHDTPARAVLWDGITAALAIR